MKDIIGILVCRLFWMVSRIPAVLIFPNPDYGIFSYLLMTF